MSGILSYVLGTGKKSGVVNLKSVEIHDIENSVEKPARSLKHLIKANHITFSIFYHNNLYHNHICHGLTSSYLLGANEEQLRTIYETETKELEEWVPAPAEVMDEDWRDFLGDKTYQRAFLDYFEDNLALEFAYDWKQVVTHFLFSGENPLFHSLASGSRFFSICFRYSKYKKRNIDNLFFNYSWPFIDSLGIRLRNG